MKMINLCRSISFVCTIVIITSCSRNLSLANNDHNLEFSKKWIADSTGKEGFRYKSLNVDTVTKKVTAVNGIDLRNLTKSQIFKLLGVPNKIVLSDTFDYFLTPNCGFSEEDCYKYVLEVKFEKGKVKDFYSSFIKL